MNIENETCPSFWDGICSTAPEPYYVNCRDLNCKWKNYNFLNHKKDFNTKH